LIRSALANRTGVAWIAVVTVAALAAAGCTSSKKPSTDSATATTGAITLAAADPTGVLKALVTTWNAGHADQAVTLKPLPGDPAARRDVLVENLGKHNPGFDVIATDLSSTAEFAANSWIRPLTGARAIAVSGLAAPAVSAGSYHGIRYTEPITADAGLLFYRSDLLKAPPTTWTKLAADCQVAQAASLACFSGQYAQGEDLTVNAIEAIYAGGGHLLSADGKRADVDTEGTRKGFQFLADSYAKKVIPASAITYRTEQSVRAFDSGALLMLRADAEAYAALSATSSAVAGKFKVAALPGSVGPAQAAFRGLGVSINASGQNQKTALQFARFLQSAPAQRTLLSKASMPPALTSLYGDTGLRSKFPFLAALQQSWKGAQPMLVSPAYQAISDAVADSAYAVVTGTKKPAQASKDLQATLSALPLG
jgi:multiple sugar transport system substrate-binding protein